MEVAVPSPTKNLSVELVGTKITPLAWPAVIMDEDTPMVPHVLVAEVFVI